MYIQYINIYIYMYTVYIYIYIYVVCVPLKAWCVPPARWHAVTWRGEADEQTARIAATVPPTQDEIVHNIIHHDLQIKQHFK
jgi:hypothetical protein